MKKRAASLFYHSHLSKLFFVFLMLTFCHTACKVKTQNNSNAVLDIDSLLISMERSPCFGKCAVYKMELYRSGFAYYKGIKDAPLKGYHTSMVSKDEIETFINTMEEAGYFKMENQYINPHITDIPTVRMYIRSGDKKKMIEIRTDEYPDELRSMDQFMDRWIHGLNWNYTNTTNE
ncbi:MAG TPA: DUF6438 domain-containing protein [Bacteroidia bacterium]|nr:DUF6438 domain-containing protein [Bacteroidia bacterium]HNT81160.1 DUF6438 domain-containing protein [Bacteroidia bacterium]